MPPRCSGKNILDPVLGIEECRIRQRLSEGDPTSCEEHLCSSFAHGHGIPSYSSNRWSITSDRQGYQVGEDPFLAKFNLFSSILVYIHRGISFLLSSIVFHVIPTALEVSMVCGILVRTQCRRHRPLITSVDQEEFLVELEVRLELCCRYCRDNAGVCMVHDQDHGLAVSDRDSCLRKRECSTRRCIERNSGSKRTLRIIKVLPSLLIRSSTTRLSRWVVAQSGYLSPEADLALNSTSTTRIMRLPSSTRH